MTNPIAQEPNRQPRSIAIYSTFCGTTNNRTFIGTPASPQYPHFFISNNMEVLETVAALGWRPIMMNVEASEDKIVSGFQAKVAKVLPHLFTQLKDFDFTFYIDDKVALDVEKVEGLVDELIAQNAPLAIRKHPPIPANVLYEFGLSMNEERYRLQWVQIVNYLCEEMSKGGKLEAEMLYATGAILRNMRHTDIIDINHTWYEHINRCGTECQISFHFVAQQYKNFALLPDKLS